MRLTPLDIKKQEFRKALRGYDPDEVEAFLEMVADEYEAAIREKNELADEALKLRTQLRDYQEVERTLKETLVTAQQRINESKESSQREADLVIREAHVKADELLEGARRKLSELKNEILMLRSQKESLSRRLRHLLESQVELLGVLEMEDVQPKELQSTLREEMKGPKSRFRLAATEADKPAAAHVQGSERGAEETGEEPTKDETSSGPVVY